MWMIIRSGEDNATSCTSSRCLVWWCPTSNGCVLRRLCKTSFYKVFLFVVWLFPFIWLGAAPYSEASFRLRSGALCIGFHWRVLWSGLGSKSLHVSGNWNPEVFTIWNVGYHGKCIRHREALYFFTPNNVLLSRATNTSIIASTSCYTLLLSSPTWSFLLLVALFVSTVHPLNESRETNLSYIVT